MKNYIKQRNQEPVRLEELVDTLKGSLGDGVLPDPATLDYYRDLKDRVIWIDYDIDESLLSVVKQIIRFNKEDKDIPVEERKPIKLLIYTYGGDLGAMFTLIDTILMSKTPVHTYNMGKALSAGFQILISGHKRYALKNSTALYHSGSGGTCGTYEQTEAQMQEYKRLVALMQNHCLSRTKIDQKTFNKYKTKDWYMSSEEQLQYGVVDTILDNPDIIYE